MPVQAINCRNATFSESQLQDYRLDVQVNYECALDRAVQLTGKERDDMLDYAADCKQRLSSESELREALTKTLKLFC
jgi:hypothetical protein